MSDTFYSLTYCVEPKPFPKSFESHDALDRYAEAQAASVAGRCDGLSRVIVGTRNGRGVEVLRRVSSLVDVPALGFLCGKSQATFRDFSPNTDVTLLAGPELDLAIEQLPVLLAFMASARHEIAKLCDGEPDDFGQAVTTNFVPPGPRMEVNEIAGDDEGYEDLCIVAHVQGVRALLENARRNGLAALHLFVYV